MEIVDFAAIIVAIATVVAVTYLITALNNLSRTLAKLEETAAHLRTEGISAFRELRQLVADADAELDKVDLVLDRADQATTAISETSRRTYEAVQDPMIRSLAVASGTRRFAQALFRRSRWSGRSNDSLASDGNEILIDESGRARLDRPRRTNSSSGRGRS